MKQIVDNKVYDTEEAEKVHAFSQKDEGEEIWHKLKQELYLTKKGKYFLTVEEVIGGDGVQYANYFEPLSEKAALEWLQRVGADADLVLKYFPTLEVA